MSSSFCCFALAIDKDKKPKWFKIWPDSPFITDYKIYLKYCVNYSDEELADKSNADCAEDLNSVIEVIKNAWDGNVDDCATFSFSKMKVLVTGGMTWGDSPTETFDAIEILLNIVGLLEEIGFEA